jgi:hypothetical protein
MKLSVQVRSGLAFAGVVFVVGYIAAGWLIYQTILFYINGHTKTFFYFWNNPSVLIWPVWSAGPAWIITVPALCLLIVAAWAAGYFVWDVSRIFKVTRELKAEAQQHQAELPPLDVKIAELESDRDELAERSHILVFQRDELLRRQSMQERRTSDGTIDDIYEPAIEANIPPEHPGLQKDDGDLDDIYR